MTCIRTTSAAFLAIFAFIQITGCSSGTPQSTYAYDPNVANPSSVPTNFPPPSSTNYNPTTPPPPTTTVPASVPSTGVPPVSTSATSSSSIPTQPVIADYESYPSQYNNPFQPSYGTNQLPSYLSNLSTALTGSTPSSSFLSNLCNYYSIDGIRGALAGLLSSSSYAQYQISNDYLRLLGRPVDPTGLQTSLALFEQGGNPAVISMIASSPEYFAVSGGNNSAFITKLYHDLLNRAPDPGGFNGWLTQMNSGASQATIVQGFVSSPEFQADQVSTYYTSLTGYEASAPQYQMWQQTFTNYPYMNPNLGPLYIAASAPSLNYLTPQSLPAVDACQGLSGNYNGTCTSSAGSNAISISVSAVGGSCQATFGGSYSCLAPATVGVTGPGMGTASVTSANTSCLAIQGTTLTIHGNAVSYPNYGYPQYPAPTAGGTFTLSGYNYAGNFQFSCQ